jgi:hypothetical protein
MNSSKIVVLAGFLAMTSCVGDPLAASGDDALADQKKLAGETLTDEVYFHSRKISPDHNTFTPVRYPSAEVAQNCRIEWGLRGKRGLEVIFNYGLPSAERIVFEHKADYRKRPPLVELTSSDKPVPTEPTSQFQSTLTYQDGKATFVRNDPRIELKAVLEIGPDFRGLKKATITQRYAGATRFDTDVECTAFAETDRNLPQSITHVTTKVKGFSTFYANADVNVPMTKTNNNLQRCELYYDAFTNQLRFKFDTEEAETLYMNPDNSTRPPFATLSAASDASSRLDRMLNDTTSGFKSTGWPALKYDPAKQILYVSYDAEQVSVDTNRPVLVKHVEAEIKVSPDMRKVEYVKVARKDEERRENLGTVVVTKLQGKGLGAGRSATPENEKLRTSVRRYDVTCTDLLPTN